MTVTATAKHRRREAKLEASSPATRRRKSDALPRGVDDGHASRHLNLNGESQEQSKQPRNKERQPDQMSHLRLRIMMRLSRLTFDAAATSATVTSAAGAPLRYVELGRRLQRLHLGFRHECGAR